MLFLSWLSGLAYAQQTLGSEASIQAKRVTEPVIIDGLLNESVWKEAGYTEFWQREPDEGKPASEQSEVWVAYDDNAVYVAARLHESAPGRISALLGRRDDELACDWFWFYLDPYHDKRSGFGFGITPAGSIADRVVYNDSSMDESWDGIWESRAQKDDQGWTLEMRIPFNQLRFSHQTGRYNWGVHFRRIIMHRNETVDSSLIPRTESGFVSRFKSLEGIAAIAPKPLITIIPYFSGKGELRQGADNQTGGNLGLDAKIGLKSNLTLDLTTNPDFGQVEVDPASINLSAAETYYSEKRPFFIEGSNIFGNFGYGGATSHWGANWGSPNLFYSRRIGRAPQGRVSGEVRDVPDWSTILGAAKMTGTPMHGWKIGAIYALTQREKARGESDLAIDVEPLTHFGVFRALKEFGSGQQGLGFMGTLVSRDFQDPLLKNQMNATALAAGLDGWSFLDHKKNWVVSGWLMASRVNGSTERISDLQREYPHYYQRPDADHLTYDSGRTSLDGWAGRIELNKEKGNLRFNAAIGAISPGFDVRDGGFQWGTDLINGHVMLGWRDYTVGKVLRNWSVSVLTQRNYNFAGDKTGEQRLILIANARFLNYWSFYVQSSHNPGHVSQTLTRGGPLMKVPPFRWYDVSLTGDDRMKLVWELSSGLQSSDDGSRGFSVNLSLRWKPSSRISLSLSPGYAYDDQRTQWVDQIEDPLMTATYGSRYLFSSMTQKTLSCSLRLSWIFTPRLSLEAFVQPFLSVGHYHRFGELTAPGQNSLRIFGQDESTISLTGGTYVIDADGPGAAKPFRIDNPDFNMKSLRGTLVLRWEYHPGSSFYFVWTQDRADYADGGYFRLGRDLGKLFSAPGDNIFMIKLSHAFNL
jgi:hypothetical protein